MYSNHRHNGIHHLLVRRMARYKMFNLTPEDHSIQGRHHCRTRITGFAHFHNSQMVKLFDIVSFMRLNLRFLHHRHHHLMVIRINHWLICHMRCYSMAQFIHHNIHLIIFKIFDLVQYRSSLLDNFTYLVLALHHQRYKLDTHFLLVRYRLLILRGNPLTICFPRRQFGSPHIRCDIGEMCPQVVA